MPTFALCKIKHSHIVKSGSKLPIMNLLQKKLSKYTAPQEAKAAGVYPYFRAISSEQDPEVIINGKKVLMFGSNCYTGLVLSLIHI